MHVHPQGFSSRLNLRAERYCNISCIYYKYKYYTTTCRVVVINILVMYPSPSAVNLKKPSGPNICSSDC